MESQDPPFFQVTLLSISSVCYEFLIRAVYYEYDPLNHDTMISMAVFISLERCHLALACDVNAAEQEGKKEVEGSQMAERRVCMLRGWRPGCLQSERAERPASWIHPGVQPPLTFLILKTI